MLLRCATALLLLALAGCARTPRSASGNSGAPPARAFAAAASAAITPGPSASTPQAPGKDSRPGPAVAPSNPKQAILLAQEQAPVAAPAAVRQNADVSSLLSVARDARILPEDFKIGALADARTGDAEERQAMSAAGSFLVRLVAGKVDAALLAPSNAATVSDMLDFGLGRGDRPRDFRIGTPKKHENGEISASVRLFSDVGTSEGEIFLTQTGGHWLVQDFQISLDDLQVKREKPKERFFPSSYRWMLED